MENVMEPDDNKWIQSIMDNNYHGSYTFAQEYADVIKTVVQKNRDGSMHKHIDLSSVSTRDLLNECYRRRAIEKFDYSQIIDTDYATMYPDAREHAIKEVLRGVVQSVLHNKKFADDAITLDEKVDRSNRQHIFTGEVYICKHPTKVKK